MVVNAEIMEGGASGAEARGVEEGEVEEEEEAAAEPEVLFTIFNASTSASRAVAATRHVP